MKRPWLTLRSDYAFAAGIEDKENAPAPTDDFTQDLANPKKRVKSTQPPAETTNMAANTKASRAKAAAKVLSPRSNNSRTLPRSPLKPGPMERAPPASLLPGRVSPMKPPQARAPSRATSRQTTRAARAPPTGAKKVAESESEGRESEGSTTSTTTTIVKKPAAAASKKSTVARKPSPKATTQSAKPVAAPKKENVVPAPASGRRVLRKRT